MTPAEMKSFTTYECIHSADLDPWMVRDEGYRRQEAAMKNILHLEKKLAVARAELAQSQEIILAGLAEIVRQPFAA